jgi:hypothetical protein
MNRDQEGLFRAGAPPVVPAALRQPPRALTLAALYDNPILWKHIRSRLRVQHLVPSVIVVVVLCSCIVWSGQLLGGLRTGSTFQVLLYLQGAILLLLGTSQVATAVSHAKATCVLDFHRVSPLPPSWIALGFLLGAPVREYLMFASTLPFAAFCAALGGVPSFLGLVRTMAFLVLSSLLFHALGLVTGLVGRGRGSGALVVAVVIVVHILANILVYSPVPAPAFLTVIPVAHMAQHEWQGQPLPGAVNAAPTFYGLPLGVAGLSFLYQAPLLVFLFLAAVRKVRRERAPLYSKGLAAALLVVLAVLSMGGLWDIEHRPGAGAGQALGAVVGVLYTLTFAALLVVVPTTPSASDIVNGLRRAAKLGQGRLSPWNDLSANRWAIVAYCAVLLASALLTLGVAGGTPSKEFWLCTSVAVLTVAQFGLGRQYFELAFGRKAQPLFLLYLFLVWLVPLLVGALLGMAGGGNQLTPAVMSISPVAGIATAAFPGIMLRQGMVQGEIDLSQLVALVSAAGLTILFGFLASGAERELRRETGIAWTARVGRLTGESD